DTTVSTAPASLVIYLGPDATELGSAHNYGKVLVGAPSEDSATYPFYVANIGDIPVTVASWELNGPGASDFTVGGLTNGAVVAPHESLPVRIRFDPIVTGDLAAVLVLNHSGVQGTSEIDLSGFGLSPGADIRVEVPNNNAGGARVGGVPRTIPNFGSITNIGSTDLIIT